MTFSLNTVRKTIWLGAVAVSIALFQNCGYVATPADSLVSTTLPSVGPADTYTTLKAEVLTDNCLGCHYMNSAEGDFTTYATMSTFFTPGSPNASPLYDSVLKNRMPKYGPVLADSLKARIYNWIAAGSPQ